MQIIPLFDTSAILTMHLSVFLFVIVSNENCLEFVKYKKCGVAAIGPVDLHA